MAFAQKTDEPQNKAPVNLPQVIQASPEAAALGRYGDQQVGLNTGTAAVQIPLYALKTKKLSLAIGLSYSSNGVKVNEYASKVGMSWVLNAGGAITRTVYDKPDLAVPRTILPPNRNFHSYNSGLNNSGSSLYQTNQELLSWLESNGNNSTDMEMDEFNFNFNGYTGKFVFDNNKIPVLLPQSNLKIEYQDQPDSKWNFKITTPDGTRYYFGGVASEMTQSSTGYSNHDRYASAWYLNRIESAGDPTDYLTFSYGETSYGFYPGVSQNVTLENKPPALYGSPRPYGYSSEVNANIPGLGLMNFTKQNIGISGVYLKSINSSHYGIVKFSYQSKPDVISKADYLLEKIEVDFGDGKAALLYSFNYDIVSPGGPKNEISDYYASDYFSLLENLSRPFLKSVVQTTANDSSLSKKYSFEYLDKGNLPPHLAFNQDHWGYYNGKTGLNSLIVPESNYILLGNTLISRLKVNRDVDYDYAQKGMLSKVIYPTGGSTEFFYEGNSSNGQTPVLTSGDFTANNPDVEVQRIDLSTAGKPSATFRVTAPITVNLTMNISCNCPKGGGCPILPDGTLAGELVFNQLTSIAKLDFAPFNARGDCSRSSGGSYKLEAGSYGVGVLNRGPYTITISVTSPDGKIFVPYQSIPGNPAIPVHKSLDGTFYGGVRVRKMIDTDPVSKQVKTTNFLYSGMSGSYLPLYQLNICRYGLGTMPLSSPTQYYTKPSMPLDYAEYYQYLAGTYSNLVGRNSYNVSYKAVTEKYGDNYENGGIDHIYSYNQNNSSSIARYGGHIVENVSPPDLSWRNGLELSKSVYKYINNIKVPVQEITNVYTVDPRISKSFEQFIIKNNGNDIFVCSPGITYCLDNYSVVGCGPYLFANEYGYNKRESIYDVYAVTSKQEWQYLSQTKTLNYDVNGQNPVTNIENYYYDNSAHTQLSRKAVTNSKGKVLTSLHTYADDYPEGVTFINDMKTNHLTGVPIEEVNYQTEGNTTEITSGKMTRYTVGGTGLIDTVLLTEATDPIPLAGFKFSNAIKGQLPAAGAGSSYSLDGRYVPRLSYRYNLTGDPITINLLNGRPEAYQWGYNNQYPVAEVKNSRYNNIFYDGFEEGNGNSNLDDSKTGHYSYTSSSVGYSKKIDGLDAGLYTLSYWKKNGANWSWVVNTAVSVTGTSYTISIPAGNQIDDICFYPSNAQMATYTYDPLVGITSMTDVKGNTTYYEYDSFQRLLNIKDKDRNIVKRYSYHFQGQ